MVLFHIRIFPCRLYCISACEVTSALVIFMSHLDCSVTVGQVGQQVRPTSTLDPTLILA